MGKPVVHAKLLGPLEILRERDAVPLPAKGRGLIAYLATSPNHTSSRDELAALLWPSSGSSSARHSLSQALYRIRKELGPETIRPGPDTITLGQVSCDTDAFEDAVSRSAWEEAGRLYRGPFAEDLVIVGAVDFEQRLDARRAHFAQLAAQTVSALAVNGHWAVTHAIADAILGHDPADLRATRAKVQAICETDGIPAARKYTELLSGQACTEAQHVLSARRSSNPGTTAMQQDSFFIGRKQAMEWLQKRYDEVLSSGSILALVDGEAGVGKTVLLRRFSRLMALRGARVLSATAYAAEQNVPFGVVGQLIQDISPEDIAPLTKHPWMEVLKHFFPNLGTVSEIQIEADPGEIGHHRLMESLRRTLVSISESRPLVLAVDDVHSTDPASRSFMHYFIRRSAEEKVLVVATARSGTDATANSVRTWSRVARYPLSGFSNEEVAEFLEYATSADDCRQQNYDVGHLITKTGGNPLLLATLVQEGSLGSDGSSTPPQTIVDFFRPRLLQRSYEARQLLAVLAIVGEPCAIGRLAELAGLSAAEAQRALAELREQELVATADNKYSLRHGLVGEVALSLQSAPDKRRLHGRAARLLTEDGTRPSPFIALSHDLAGNRGEAFKASMEASKACDVLHARSEKEFFLKLALSNAPSRDEEGEVRIQLAEHLLLQRRLSDALKILDLDTFAACPDRLFGRAQVMRLRVLAEMTGDVEVLKNLWDQARDAGSNLSAMVIADTYTHIAGVAYDLGADEIAIEAAELIVDRLSDLPLDEKTAFRMLRPTGISGFLQGYDGALAQFDNLPSAGAKNPVYSATFNASKGALLVAAGRLREAEELFAISLGIAERYALVDNIHLINNNLGVCLMEQGRYDEAESRHTEAMKYAADTSPREFSTSRDNLTVLSYERGAYEAALEGGTALLAAREVWGGRAVMSLLAIIGLSALEMGDLTRCREAERELQVYIQRTGRHSNDMSYVHIFLARMLALRRNYTEAIEALLAAGEYYRSRNLLAGLRMDIERCRLQMAVDMDCSDDLARIAGELSGTGAVPLVEKLDGLKTRAAGARG